MGARLSLLAPSAATVAISSYVDVLESFQYVELLNNSRFLKTIKAVDTKSGNLVIIKILIKPTQTASSNYSLRLEEVTELLAKLASVVAPFHNVLPWHKIIETDRAGYIIRQMAKTNLYDRLSLRPFLDPVEKLFLVFQMLKIVSDLHSLHVRHGDLKLENFLVTSWNWLMVADFAEYTKPTYIPEDNPNQFSFYFDSSDRRVCYLAPERFYNTNDNTNVIQNIDDDGHYSGVNRLTDEMDLFSLGCVVAELYSDGEPTFTLAQLFKYKRNEFVPDLSSIEDNDIKLLINQLIQFDPEKRVAAQELIDSYKDKCFPNVFYNFLYDFMADLNNNELYTLDKNDDNASINDLKLDRIYNNFDKIVTALEFDYSMEKSRKNSSSFLPLKLNLPGMPRDYVIKPNNYSKDGPDVAAVILLNVVFSLMKTLKRVSSKIKACELILALSERVNDECKLDRSLPSLCSLLDEFVESSSNALQQNRSHAQLFQSVKISSKVACVALTSITTLLLSCSYITPINVLTFPEYLLPKLTSIALLNIPKDESNMIKVTLAGCLPYLANCSKKFWMMSKTFNSDALKDYNKIVSYSVNENLNDDILTLYNALSIPKALLDVQFEGLTFILLTDSSPLVRISLVENILPLCHFFGIDKTNEIILPHLISYLNETSTIGLKLAFLSSTLKLAPYVGVLTFEQYILPLLIQALGDLEQFVVLKVLEIFNEFVKTRLINPRTEFNALEIYKELLSNSINLLLHPNEWIRQSVLTLIISISENLTNADRYCFLYPLIKGFLSYDLSVINWQTLYPCLTKPLTKQVYELAISWCLNASNKSLFWQQKNFSTLNQLNTSKKKLVSFSKNMGKSVYLPKLNSEVTFAMANGSTSTLPLSPEDKQWLIKLKSVGLEDKGLWKVFILRDYIFHIAKSANGGNSSQNLDLEEKEFNIAAENPSITPRNIFFDICYKSEPLLSGSRTIEENIDASTNPGESVSLKDFESRRGSASLILLNFSKVKASVQTVEASVFGELETSHEVGNPDSYHQHHHHVHSTKSSNSTHRMFVVNKMKMVTANIKHSYSGLNPYMLNYLNSIDFDPSLSDFPEFGNIVKSTKLSMSTVTDQQPWSPKGILVSQINSGRNSKGEIDGINCLVSGPTSEFFVSGSELGWLRIWDNYRMEKVTSGKHSSLSVNLKSTITSIKFISDRFVMAVTTIDGSIRIFRIDVSRGKSKRIIKYPKVSLIRKYDLVDDYSSEGAYFVNCEFVLTEKQSWLVGITSNSKVVCLDIIKMEKVFELDNPLIHGIPKTFIVDHSGTWLLIGTSQGIICLWDLRFKLLTKVWKVKLQEGQSILSGYSSVRKLVLLPSAFKLNSESDNGMSESGNKAPASYFVMIGGSSESDISVWSIPSFECKLVLSSHVDNPFQKKYSLEELDNTGKVYDIDRIFENIRIDVDGITDSGEDSNHSMTAIKYFSFADGKKNYFISSTWDRRIIAWNLDNIKASTSLNVSNETDFIVNSYNALGQRLINEIFLKDAKAPKSSDRRSYSLEELAKSQLDALARHQDTITAIDVITKPFEMIISADRNGYINLYK